MMNNKEEISKDKAFGSVLGAFVGDAAGAYLEFKGGSITKQDVKEALEMPGGGVLGVGPGQITDDSEMAMCLLNALTKTGKENGKYTIDIDQIGYNYYEWTRSDPFDIGITTQQAFYYVNNRILKEKSTENMKQITHSIYSGVWNHNKASQSNGCLMRITPLAVWGHKLPKKKLLHSVAFQTFLTHCNPTMIFASYLYCLAIAHLINKPNDAKNAFDQSMEEVDQIYKEYPKLEDDLRKWMDEIASEKCKLPNAQQQMGWSKIAFQYAFRDLFMYSKNEKFGNVFSLDSITHLFYKNEFHLHSYTRSQINELQVDLMKQRLSEQEISQKQYQKILYEYSLQAMLIQRGDTDTNACIVGGLIGALVGRSSINEQWINKMLSYDFETAEGECIGHERPDIYSPKKKLMNNLEILYENASNYNPDKDQFQMRIFGKEFTKEEDLDELLDIYLQLKDSSGDDTSNQSKLDRLLKN